MKKLRSMLMLLTMVFMMIFVNQCAYAGTYGDYEYTIEDGDYTTLDTRDGTSYITHRHEAVIHKYTGSATSITDLPTRINGYPVYSIDMNAFEGCDTITSVTIPYGYTTVAGFIDCVNLTSVTLPSSVTTIGYRAFEGCRSLTGISLPSGVTTIGGYAFYGCSSLTSISLPSGVTTIEGGAFWNCSSLTSIVIPSGVTSIDGWMFVNCSSLTSVTIPSGVTSIGDDAFSGCSSLTGVTIPSGVTSIGMAAFAHCSSLTSITIPANVNKIGSSALQDCTKLSSVYFKGKRPNIGSYAFAGDTFTAYINTDYSWNNISTSDSDYRGNITWRVVSDSSGSDSSLKTAKLVSLKNNKSKKLTIRWRKVSGITGYKIQISTKASFKNAKTYTVKGKSVSSKTIAVKKNKTYYVRICTYKGSETSKWSAIRKIKIRK